MKSFQPLCVAHLDCEFTISNTVAVSWFLWFCVVADGQSIVCARCGCFPSRPKRRIVPFPPGGNDSMVASLPRNVASRLVNASSSNGAANGKVSSKVTALDSHQRIEEIARIMGGVKIAGTTRKHEENMCGVRWAFRKTVGRELTRT